MKAHFGGLATQPRVEETGVKAIACAGGFDGRHRVRSGKVSLAVPQERRAFASQFQGHPVDTGVPEALKDSF